MLEMIKKQRQIFILSTILVLVTLFALFQYKRAEELSYRRELEYNRVFAELTEYVDDLQITLLKGQVVSTPMQMSKLSALLHSQASGAKANLAQLPINGRSLEKTSEFLSQVGEYANCISEKMLKGENLSPKEIKTMQELCRYAYTLKSSLDEMMIRINEGKIDFEEKEKYMSAFKGGKVAMASELAALEEEFHNYPSLIYDGPFSQHLSLKEAVFTKGKAELSEKQVLKKARNIIGEEKASITQIGGKLPSYSVNTKSTVVEYTKEGGVLLMMMKDRHIGEENLSAREAKKKAESFLKEQGFESMQESYYENMGGSMIINYAYRQDGYVVFPDLVKVKVALDDGEIIGFESRGYVMNHTYRSIPKPVITKEEALSNVNPELEIKDTSFAVVPLENGKEACCYQIKGIVSDKHFLIYVNTQTGDTEDVQILLENERGTLAV